MDHPVYFVFLENSNMLNAAYGMTPYTVDMYDTFFDAEDSFRCECAKLSQLAGHPGTIRLVRVETDYTSRLIREYCHTRGVARIVKARRELLKLPRLAEYHQYGNVVDFSSYSKSS